MYVYKYLYLYSYPSETPPMSSGPSSQDDRFETLDWENTSADGRGRPSSVRAFVASLGLLGVGMVYDYVETGPLRPGLDPSILDWLTAVSLVAFVTFVVIPLVRKPKMAARYWENLRTNRAAVVSLAYVLALFAVGLAGPLVVSDPELSVMEGFQPPVGLSVDADYIPTCVGPVTEGRCHGTWQYPLGTTGSGKDLLTLVVYGARTSVQVVLVSAMFLVPTGVAVGLVAAYAGGLVDSVLMRVAELLQTVPAIFVYLLFWDWNVNQRLLVLIAVFGLASWGGLARLVRNEALERREELYVKAAELGGADRSQITRWHLLPNVSGPVLANVALQIPMLILTEAALSFVVLPVATGTATLGDPTVVSWGQLIYHGTKDVGIDPRWWITVVPAAALTATVLSFNVLGDALSDAFDPRTSY